MTKKLPLTLIATTLLLALSACTGSNTTQPTNGPSTSLPSPSVSADPNKYTFAATTGPNMQFGVQLLSKTKFVDQKVNGGLLNAAYGNCGVVFVDKKIITADHLLTTAEQIQQSDNWITEYAKKVGAQPDSVANGSLNTTETIPGQNGTYNIATRQATFQSSKYNGVLEARVFPDGTGVALTFLCSTGVTVPDVLSNARVTTKPLPTPTVTPSATASPQVTATDAPLPNSITPTAN